MSYDYFKNKKTTNLAEESERLNSSSKFLIGVFFGLSETFTDSCCLDLFSLIFVVLEVDFFVIGR